MLARLAERLRRTDRNDGFIIVAVLWILAALATLAAVIAVYVINTAMAFAVHDERVQAESLTRAAIELSLYNIVRDAEQPASRGAFAFRMGTANVAAELAANGIAMAVSRARPPVQSILRRTGFESRIGTSRFYPTVRSGVHGILGEPPV